LSGIDVDGDGADEGDKIDDSSEEANALCILLGRILPSKCFVHC
jgi:hypothetical protein